jgi:hypothetical protein
VLVKQTPERANVTSADRLNQRDSNDIIHGQGQHIVLRDPCECVGLCYHLTIDSEHQNTCALQPPSGGCGDPTLILERAINGNRSSARMI